MKRAVLVVCDGLRADMVTPELTPNLARLAGHTFSTASLVYGTCLFVERTLMFAFCLLRTRQLIMSAMGHKQT